MTIFVNLKSVAGIFIDASHGLKSKGVMCVWGRSIVGGCVLTLPTWCGKHHSKIGIPAEQFLLSGSPERVKGLEIDA